MSHRNLGRTGGRGPAVKQASGRQAGREMVLGRGLSSERKISECLLELINPFRQDVETEGRFKVLLGIGAMAWNASDLSRTEVQEWLQEMDARDLSSRDRWVVEELKDRIWALIERKKRLFPHDPRTILNYDAVQANGLFHITATSGIIGQQHPAGEAGSRNTADQEAQESDRWADPRCSV